MARLVGPVVAGVLLALIAPIARAGDVAGVPDPTPQVPVALAWGEEGRLLVALRDGRRVIEVEPTGWTVGRSWPLGFRAASLARSDDGAAIFVGGMDGELARLVEGQVERLGPDGKGPTRVVALADGRVAAGSVWGEAVRVVDPSTGAVDATHPLPFAPGAMARHPDGRLIVADAFGGRLAVLEPGRPEGLRLSAIDGVNLHALAVAPDGKELLVGHLTQYAPVPINSSNIDWGLIVSARLSGVRLADLDKPLPPASTVERRRLTLDGSGNGAADPAAVAATPDGSKVVVALAGAHQLMVNDRAIAANRPATSAGLRPLGDSQLLQTVEVGRSPVDVALTTDGSLAITADSMSDTLSVVRLESMEVVATVKLGPGPSAGGAVARGEALFRDGRRSMDRWMSCASCHAGGHTNGLNFDTQGDGGSGAPKNTPSLLGAGATAPYTWIGRFDALGPQVHQSFLTSLRGPAPEEEMVEDVAAYLASLAPPPPRRDPADPAARRGAEVFEARGCDGCHVPPAYTSRGTRDVGLDDGGGGHRRFNPPSLRNAARTAPYFHDGRAATLAEALRAHAPGSLDPPGDDEIAALVAFLESL